LEGADGKYNYIFTKRCDCVESHGAD
jgi:hypothetical protein